MFTGIIEEIGRVKERRFSPLGGCSNEIAVEAKILGGAKPGDSISVHGVCLTVTKLKGNIAAFDLSDETKKRTNVGALRIGDKVNVERALKADDRLGGHFVLGHVDCVGKIRSIKYKEMEIRLPHEFMRYIVEKGSVAVDGVSLTVGKVMGGSFVIYLVPHTLNTTTLGLKRIGDSVNIETDILGKYVVDRSLHK